ncbi:murein hydrolase activator EnvC family protein [Niallia oryzisoli]|uniref:murein hydrolase activator EnvC family protein n=1 Tax=Niallia oryzisoli TaxID=1737571 RepID=UPI0037369ED7
MKKTFITLSLIATLGVGGIIGEGAPVKAAETNLEYTQSDIESKLKLANNKISDIQTELESAQLNYEKISNEISNTQAKINEKEQQITDAKNKIEKLQTEINELIKRIEARDGLLKDRARSLQESGGNISYLEVLLNSQSFSDFINRTEAVVTFLEADRDILESYQTDKDNLDKSQSDLKIELTSLELMITEMKTMEEDLNIKKTEQNDLIEKLKEQEKDAKVKVSALESEKNALNNNQVSLQTNTAPQIESAISQGSSQVVENGLFIWPTIGGTITTYQGMRWGSFHKGIDIARPADYSILAASSGTVTYAGWINGYGNTIKIQHSNGYTTQYAHLASINVAVGQSVSQGSKIGVMGSTGRSTGIHLDFEVYNNGKLLNPMDVLPGR